MNIFQCRNGVKGGLECIFRITRLDEDGNKKYLGCLRHGGQQGFDIFNLYPEHDPLTGDAVYQPTNQSDPFKIGEIILSWENLTSHQSGRNFDYRDFPADVHPQYSIAEHNHPTKAFLGEDDLGEIFGDDSPALVHSGWNTEKFYKIPSVEHCQGGIYGRFDSKSDMISHACLRSYIGTPNWINYTNSKESTQKKDIYIGYASDQEIIDFSKSMFKNEKIATRMSEAMILVKQGHFINLWTLMTNNFVSVKTKKEFMNRTSTVSEKSIYKGKANLYYFYTLYSLIDSMMWYDYITDVNGKTTMVPKSTYKHIRLTLKENLLNWVLNHPILKKISLIGLKYSTEQRYWFVVLLLKRARRDRVLNGKAILPSWIIDIIKEKNDPRVKLFNDSMNYSQLPAEYKDEFHVAQHANLGTTPNDSINSLYPGMINIKKELFGDGKKIDPLGWGQFLQILKIGQRWSISEIRNAFEHFIPSWIKDEPAIFYGWLQNVADLSMEEIDTVSPEEFKDLLKKEGRRSVGEPGPVQLLEYGANNFNHGDGGLSPARAFANNLLNISLNWENWITWDDWNAVKIPIGNWYEVTAKVHNVRECNHETFWAMLAAHGGLTDDRKEIERIFTDQTLEEALEASLHNIATTESIVEAGLDGDDLTNLMCDDPCNGTITHLDKGEGSWGGEE